ncbi:MAG: ribosome assembly RNA-binding protein YhbY [Gammaproteobacteria bacterium]|nr:ribosome assembly RNA-binding protein YhbY [Pseudomonadota bacterium]MCZ6538061.1 ribosome assembly RNA-binding protein YhbY [Gammaproteobacteria bacterium]MCZ6686850.1 ribosome assembly RNA-binding protein YhbY [Gammaproteobacteria bacterium]MCZ6761370.1 ribosome assembly RNA-binding protein YhbY [Gammaproteobacteria bacterium]MCZ6881073.1 ribosome assembly RNA-binding protein YhbY [Gammaproteobacteria bacterium]
MLNEAQKKFLRGRAHSLKPVVWIGGSGLSEAVATEIEQALASHELLKTRIRVGNRDSRNEIIQRICRERKAELVQRIGNTAVFYRANSDLTGIILPA